MRAKTARACLGTAGVPPALGNGVVHRREGRATETVAVPGRWDRRRPAGSCAGRALHTGKKGDQDGRGPRAPAQYLRLRQLLAQPRTSRLDIMRIDLDADSAAAALLGGNQGRPAAEERIEDDGVLHPVQLDAALR
ncbi:hypothetical protein SAMN05519103_07946 [Rhizobiales bacterium GAS113]|nr:hypothetical protein SAMN05519103_07946 [Rhizobiales bacterium GAS113]